MELVYTLAKSESYNFSGKKPEGKNDIELFISASLNCKILKNIICKKLITKIQKWPEKWNSD